MSPLLITLDVGGTLGRVDGPSLAAILIRTSPLDPGEARSIVRRTLHTKPSISPRIVAEICCALRIPTSAFPRVVEPSPLQLVPEAPAALQSMSQHAALVTLSNVTCLEARTDQLRALLHPWVRDYFPSCRIGHAKPDPAAFRHVARACGTTTAHMVHIGDDWTCDVVGARSAGVTAIWVSHGRPAPETDWLTACGVLVAADLATASRQVIEIAQRRRS